MNIAILITFCGLCLAVGYLYGRATEVLNEHIRKDQKELEVIKEQIRAR